ncbi:hypothetical protein TWF481_002229 [Arthrobotrys musiformis]|uniref:Uncharacterized protein n=1 Tax=Arthrobotrys musiformis TaxID=47236 RepID=A0AAV9VSM2_9PEZI
MVAYSSIFSLHILLALATSAFAVPLQDPVPVISRNDGKQMLKDTGFEVGRKDNGEPTVNSDTIEGPGTPSLGDFQTGPFDVVELLWVQEDSDRKQLFEGADARNPARHLPMANLSQSPGNIAVLKRGAEETDKIVKRLPIDIPAQISAQISAQVSAKLNSIGASIIHIWLGSSTGADLSRVLDSKSVREVRDSFQRTLDKENMETGENKTLETVLLEAFDEFLAPKIENIQEALTESIRKRSPYPLLEAISDFLKVFNYIFNEIRGTLVDIGVLTGDDKLPKPAEAELRRSVEAFLIGLPLRLHL